MINHPLFEVKTKDNEKLQDMTLEDINQFNFDFFIKQAESEEI